MSKIRPEFRVRQNAPRLAEPQTRFPKLKTRFTHNPFNNRTLIEARSQFDHFDVGGRSVRSGWSAARSFVSFKLLSQ